MSRPPRLSPLVYTTYDIVLGRVIAAHREQRKLTQTRVSLRVGISRSEYACLETAMIDISVRQLRKVAEALGTTTAIELLSLTDLVATRLRHRRKIAVVHEAALCGGDLVPNTAVDAVVSVIMQQRVGGGRR